MSSALGSELERDGYVLVITLLAASALLPSIFYFLSLSFFLFFIALYLPSVICLPSYILVPNSFQVNLFEWSWEWVLSSESLQCQDRCAIRNQGYKDDVFYQENVSLRYKVIIVIGMVQKRD